MNPSLSIQLRHVRIAKVDSLAKALYYDKDNLQYLIDNYGSHLYREVPIIKSNGSVRMCYDAFEPLKTLHARIALVFFKNKHFKFPTYITGSVKGQDFKTNAERHVGAVFQASEDIASFFPSTLEESVFAVWRDLFKLPDEIATHLTTLTTLNGVLPQGASTSPFLANCIFFRDEPNLVEELQNKGFVYSRYVDDITISSLKRVEALEKTFMMDKLIGMLTKNQYYLARAKHSMASSATQSKMISTGVITGFESLKLPKEARKSVDIAIFRFTKTNFSNKSKEKLSQYNSLRGRINNISRFHPAEAKKLKDKLEAEMKKS